MRRAARGDGEKGEKKPRGGQNGAGGYNAKMPSRFLVLAVCLAAVGRADDLAARADRFIQYFVNNRLFQGTVLVAQDGQPVFRKAYGQANADWRIPNGPDTKYRIGSMTKQF